MQQAYVTENIRPSCFRYRRLHGFSPRMQVCSSFTPQCPIKELGGLICPGTLTGPQTQERESERERVEEERERERAQSETVRRSRYQLYRSVCRILKVRAVRMCWGRNGTRSSFGNSTTCRLVCLCFFEPRLDSAKPPSTQVDSCIRHEDASRDLESQSVVLSMGLECVRNEVNAFRSLSCTVSSHTNTSCRRSVVKSCPVDRQEVSRVAFRSSLVK